MPKPNNYPGVTVRKNPVVLCFTLLDHSQKINSTFCCCEFSVLQILKQEAPLSSAGQDIVERGNDDANTMNRGIELPLSKGFCKLDA